MTSACSIPLCERPLRYTGLCHIHYDRLRRHGDPLFKRPTEVERFWRMFEKRDGCWVWVGQIATSKYGVFSMLGNNYALAHRYAYELLVGPIPQGLEIDHLCHTFDPTCPGGLECLHRRCVNPSHLEVVTHEVNMLRKRQRLAE